MGVLDPEGLLAESKPPSAGILDAETVLVGKRLMMVVGRGRKLGLCEESSVLAALAPSLPSCQNIILGRSNKGLANIVQSTPSSTAFRSTTWTICQIRAASCESLPNSLCASTRCLKRGQRTKLRIVDAVRNE